MAYTSKNIVSLTSHQHLLKRLSLTFGPESGGEFSSQKTVAAVTYTHLTLPSIHVV